MICFGHRRSRYREPPACGEEGDISAVLRNGDASVRSFPSAVYAGFCFYEGGTFRYALRLLSYRLRLNWLVTLFPASNESMLTPRGSLRGR